MRFNFGEKEIDFSVSSKSSIISKHSNRCLEQLTLVLSLPEKFSEEFRSCLVTAKKEGVTSVDADKNVLKHWTVKNDSYSYSTGNPIHQFQIDVAEVEVLNPSSLQIGELNLYPYVYKEYFFEEKLRLDARVTLTREQHSLFQSLIDSFDTVTVIRHGISEEPRQMLLSYGYWSIDDSEIKSEVRLVEPEAETDTSVPPLQFVHEMKYQLASTQLLVNGLLEKLVNKGILSADDATQLREEVASSVWKQQHNFYRVDKLD